MSTNKREFSIKPNQPPKEFNTLIKKPAKKITIAGEQNFSNDALSPLSKNPIEKEIKTTEKNNKRGRPIVVKDQRFKVNRPKMISSALESKLAVTQDYVEEFQSITGRITFEKYINTLLEAYIKSKLSVSKEERLRQEINEAFEKLEQK